MTSTLFAMSASAEFTRRGQEVGRGFGGLLSRSASRILGTYDEVLAFIPHVHSADATGRDHNFVPGMLSNGAMSIWGDRILGCGYQKRMAVIEREGLDRYAAHAIGRQASLSFDLIGAQPWLETAPSTEWLELSRAPLLGIRSDGRIARSFLDRSFDSAEPRVRSVTARLRAAGRVVPGLPDGDYAVSPLSTTCPLGAFQVKALDVRLTYPTCGGYTRARTQ